VACDLQKFLVTNGDDSLIAVLLWHQQYYYIWLLTTSKCNSRKCMLLGSLSLTASDKMKTTSDDTETTVDARLERVALLLEELAAELRGLKSAGVADAAAPKPPAAVPSSEESPCEIKAGRRVRVVRRDQYYNRVGVVKRRHGRMFWDVQLEATETRCASLIFKKDASLCVIGPV
jgi:hypothetical protein